MVKTRIRKNDMVQVINGAESGRIEIGEGEDERLRGRRGRVLEVDREKGRAVVEGLHMVYRHERQSRDPSRPGGGRVEKASPIALANLMVVCSKCDKATRLGVRSETHEREGGKPKVRRVRVCKKCNADIPERT